MPWEYWYIEVCCGREPQKHNYQQKILGQLIMGSNLKQSLNKDTPQVKLGHMV